jgi:hypothetical protein
MKKEVFVKLINICEEHRKKCQVFGKEIQKAYLNAGLERDFSTEMSYEYPYSPIIDKIVDAISIEFSNNDSTCEIIKDILNWWIWECDFGHGWHLDFSSNDGNYSKTSRAVMTIKNKKYIMNTPSKLYDVILKYIKVLNAENTNG